MTAAAPSMPGPRSPVTVSRRSDGIARAHASKPRRKICGPLSQRSTPQRVSVQTFGARDTRVEHVAHDARPWHRRRVGTEHRRAGCRGRAVPGSDGRASHRRHSARDHRNAPSATCGRAAPGMSRDKHAAPSASSVRTVSMSDSPLTSGAARGVERHHVATECSRRQLERDPGPRRRLGEERRHGPAGQRSGKRRPRPVAAAITAARSSTVRRLVDVEQDVGESRDGR